MSRLAQTSGPSLEKWEFLGDEEDFYRFGESYYAVPIYRDNIGEMAEMLTRHGKNFCGNNVNDEAEGWADQGFRVDDAESWCEIGVWDAATAAELRDANLTPDDVASAAESLTEGLDDPAEEYTDGDPIYAACNGDICVSVIIDAARR